MCCSSVAQILANNKQLLDEVLVICKIINVKVRVTDNSFRDIDNFAYHKN